ncbi:hypothetical protein TBLA_0D03920 [Henningerozyma blattae CBS 6284]|uniref:Uncharacterized protein n=1 Tax=Henningerozyma blattae (strain ATCC 34711 / CBS 6284 / DSM 70876 / NBRC 10599 / NRRL Y-10934 / UCD 77-7) TaxID=1071380 RepID=I2H3D8_HENB6|nr:hypothetical protein TBLA_0D03920 [Tetrapisispora blattae CBS 6284]CCH60890.1 hypothetical protein TBLA_0D03920 [Tetrapisispora blattae CBS 6284]
MCHARSSQPRASFPFGQPPLPDTAPHNSPHRATHAARSGRRARSRYGNPLYPQQAPFVYPPPETRIQLEQAQVVATVIPMTRENSTASHSSSYLSTTMLACLSDWPPPLTSVLTLFCLLAIIALLFVCLFVCLFVSCLLLLLLLCFLFFLLWPCGFGTSHLANAPAPLTQTYKYLDTSAKFSNSNFILLPLSLSSILDPQENTLSNTRFIRFNSNKLHFLKMQFSTVASVAAVAAVASAASNVTTMTATQESTTLVTITSCEDHRCVETTSDAIVSIATVTVDNVITSYTTWCPIETTAAPTANNTVAPAPSTSSKNNGSTTTTICETCTKSVYEGAANKALPAAGALVAGIAAMLM